MKQQGVVMVKRFYCAALMLVCLSVSSLSSSYSGPSYVTGEIVNITSLSSGLLMRIGVSGSDPEVPQN